MMTAQAAVASAFPAVWSGSLPAQPTTLLDHLDRHCRITGVQRTWLDHSGRGKAAMALRRRALGHLLGNGVRFGVARDVLAAAEGVETMLALRTALPTLSKVAALSAGHLAALRLPPTLRRHYVARDNDAAGRQAAEHLGSLSLGGRVPVRAGGCRAGSSTVHVLVELQLYGHRPFEDDPAPGRCPTGPPSARS